ncbi:MAG: acyl-CoA dehydrogenase family protein, partial [Sphingomonadales bacterium]|nr:acyl-CoA dehydrogenase family protein [Sphingomonadales bacterium]
MDAVLRGSLGAMGWFGLAVPEDCGGSGLGAVEHALFFREVGRQCGPVDVLAQSLAANMALAAGLRAAVIAGEVGVALLVPDGAGDGSSFRLLGGGHASHALQVTRAGAALFEVAALAVEPRPALDPANSLARVAGVGAPLAAVEDARLWQLGELGVAAMLVGIAEAALDLIVAYAKVRETFGRKIGAWQAVRHPCADMAVRAEAARAQLWYAAAALKEARGDAGVHLDAARHLAAQAALANADTSIQLHGGIGVT